MNESNTNGTPWFEPGKFVKATKAQFRSQMRPCCDLKTRIWACLMLHTAGFHGELAQIIKKNQVVPMRLPDVAKELRQVEQEYYQAVGIEPPAAITDWNVRRKFRELEEDGVCERRLNGVAVRPESNLISKEIQIFVWFEPKKPARQIIKRTRIRQEPMPIQGGLFDRRTLRWIEKTFRVETLDPRIPEFLKSAQSDPRFAEAVSVALAKAAAAFSENLPLGEIQLVEKAEQKSGHGRNEKAEQKSGHGRNEKADMGATNSEALYRNKTVVKLNTTLTAAAAAVRRGNPAAAAKIDSEPNTKTALPLPITLAEIQKHDPSADQKFATRVYSASIVDCPVLTDQTLALCVAESYATEKNHGTGLLLHRVPRIAVTMAQNGWKSSKKKSDAPSVYDVFPHFRKDVQ